jgi:transposase InsO family protein
VATYRFIHAEEALGTWSVRRMCSALRVHRSGYYAWRDGPPSSHAAEDARLVVHIKAIHRRSRGTYGAPRVHAELVAEGHHVGRHRVARLMREQGLAGIPKKRFKVTTDSDHDAPIAPNLLDRDFAASAPNRAWVGDITYLRTRHGWAYLAVLIDLHSRKVVGWSVADHMRTELVEDALQMAVATRAPEPGLVHHTDRGVQYASGAYQGRLAQLGAQVSMSRKGDCWDNAVAESFFGTLEQELVGQSDRWEDADAVRTAVGDYIHCFYNAVRRHKTLGQRSPVEFEAQAREEALAA